MKDMELGQILKIIFQSVYYRLKISKKEKLFLLRANSYRFDRSWPKIKIFHARGRPLFQENFYLQTKNPNF